jgi:hypothetical protein
MLTAGTHITTCARLRGGSRLPIAAAYIVALILPALAQKPDYSHVPPEIRQWFRDQKEPKTGNSCCNEADGGQAQEEIRNGRYWASWCIVGNSKAGTCERSSGWIEVPEDVVIHGPNMAGHPVVWSYISGGKYVIRCFAPGVKS